VRGSDSETSYSSDGGSESEDIEYDVSDHLFDYWLATCQLSKVLILLTVSVCHVWHMAYGIPRSASSNGYISATERRIYFGFGSMVGYSQ